MWKRFEPQRSCARAQQLRRVALPGVLLAVEAQQAAGEEHRERDVGVDAEQELVTGRPWLAPASSCRRRGTNCMTATCRSRARRPRRSEGGRLRPVVVERRLRLRRSGALLQSTPLSARGAQARHRTPPRSGCRARPAARPPRAGCARSRRASRAPRRSAGSTGTRARPGDSPAARCRRAESPRARRRAADPPWPARARAIRRARARRGAATSRGRGRRARRSAPPASSGSARRSSDTRPARRCFWAAPSSRERLEARRRSPAAPRSSSRPG